MIHVNIIPTEEVEVQIDSLRGPQGKRGIPGERGSAGARGEKGDRGPAGPAGPAGADGQPGKDGVSPAVKIEPIDGGYRIRITDKEGEHMAVIMNGEVGPVGPAGAQGPQGERGAPFVIEKIYKSLDAMNDGYASDGVSIGSFVLIETGDVNDEENARLYVKSEVRYEYVTDLSGAQGIQGPQGPIGPQGQPGPTGPEGKAGYTPQKGVDYFDGAPGTPGASVTVSSVSDSSEDGGSNVVTFSDGKTLTVKNGKTGPAGADGKDGAQGPAGPAGPAGSDATVTAANIKSALGYTPASEASVSQLSEKIGDVLPDYWLAHLAEKIPNINTAMESAGRDKSSFFFYTDGHRINSANATPSILRYLYKQTSIQKTNNGGDFFEPNATGMDSLSAMRDRMADVRGLPNHHSVIGNHDEDNEALRSDTQLYGFYLAWEENNDIVWGGYHYYYIDDKAENTRYIYLDTGKFAVSDAETQFVIETLTSVPSGWHVVAVSHIWYDYDISQIPLYCQKLLYLFDAYNARISGSVTMNTAAISYDFTGAAGWVEFCVGGHIHWDATLQSPNGIPVVLTDCDSYYTRGSTAATAGTITEACISAIIADYDAKTLRLVRIGRGSDRNVSLIDHATHNPGTPVEPGIPVEPSYTNLLPTSKADDGVSIYNGVGYKSGVRYSTSSKAETTATGCVLSGWIKVKTGDVVRLRNISLDPAGAGNINNVVYQVDSGSTLNVTAKALTENTSYGAVVGSDGYIAQFTVDISSGKMRINASYIGSDSIITVNEKID